MKIGIFDPYLDTLSGGEKYMLSIASCLSKENEVFIFWDKDKEAEIRSGALKKLGIDLSQILFYKNIFDKNISLAKRLIESKKFDSIVYLSDGSIPFVGAKLYIHFQFPVEHLGELSTKDKIKLSLVRKIFCNSNFTKYFIDKKLKVKSLVLYPPVQIKNRNNIKKENIILHVGRFYEDSTGANYKKQDVMIDAFRKMADAGLKNWKLVMVIGVKDKDKEKSSKFQQNAKGYSIEIIENPPDEILWANYAKAKIYWHATGFGEDLESFPEKAEHFGISTVEAMGAGAVPVVVNAGGQKEIIEDGENGYLWDTLEEFIEKTNNLIKDVRLWTNMSEEAIKRSRVFSEERFCKEVKQIIEQ